MDQLPDPLGSDMRNKEGQVMKISKEKKHSQEAAVGFMCRDLYGVMKEPFDGASRRRFNTFLKAQVRGNLYPLIASLPNMTGKEYFKVYRRTYSRQTDADFMKLMYDRFSDIKLESEDAPPPISEEEKTKLGHEVLALLENDADLNEAVRRTSHKMCWYWDYAYDKSFTKFHKSGPLNMKFRENFENGATKVSKVEAMETEEISTQPIDSKILKDFSELSFEQLLAKIEANEDMDSVVNFIDLKLIKMAAIIKDSIEMLITPNFEARLRYVIKQLGLYASDVKVKSRRKLYFATIATQESTTTKLLRGYTGAVLVRPVPCKALNDLFYQQNLVCFVSHEQYKALLARHMTSYGGYTMIAVKTFPDEEVDLLQPETETRQEDETWAPTLAVQ